MRAEPGLTARSAPGNGSSAGDDTGVDRAEGGGGEGGEHARVRRQRLGHALATGQPGPDELVGVGPVGLGARRAHGRAAVAARDVDRPVRQVLGVQAVEDLASDGVDVPDGATQPDRPNTASSSQGSGQPAVIVIPGGALEQLDAEAPAVLARSRPVVYQDGGKSQRRRDHARTPVGRSVRHRRACSGFSFMGGSDRLWPHGGPAGCWVLASLDEKPCSGSAVDLGGDGAWSGAALRSAWNRQRETLGRTGRRQVPRAVGTALVVAAQEMDVRALSRRVGGTAPELMRSPVAEFHAETAFLMLPMPWAVDPASSAALRLPSPPLCVQCASDANVSCPRTVRSLASVEGH